MWLMSDYEAVAFVAIVAAMTAAAFMAGRSAPSPAAQKCVQDEQERVHGSREMMLCPADACQYSDDQADADQWSLCEVPKCRRCDQEQEAVPASQA